MLEKTKAVQGPLGGRVEEGTSKGSTAAVVYMVVRDSHQSAPISGFNRKQQETSQNVKEEKNTFKTITYSLILINRKPLRNQIRKIKEKEFRCRPGLCWLQSSKQRAGVHYLVGVSMSEDGVVLPRAIAGSVLVHGWGGRGFFQQAALCRRGEEEF